MADPFDTCILDFVPAVGVHFGTVCFGIVCFGMLSVRLVLVVGDAVGGSELGIVVEAVVGGVPRQRIESMEEALQNL